MFETETMAELCVQQGLLGEATEIYRRLVANAPDEITGARRRQRLQELERQSAATAKPNPARAGKAQAQAPVTKPATPASSAAPAAAPAGALPLPGVHATWDRRHTVVQWRLPAETEAPALELLLVLKTAAGILTERRTLRLEKAEGRMALPVPDLHTVRAAAGRLEGERFVPMARDSDLRADSDPPR